MQTTQEIQQVNPTAFPNKSFPFDERLSSWEMGELWLTYQACDSLSCIFKYFVSKAQDSEIKALLTDTLNLFTNQIASMNTIFSSVGFAIPQGYNDKDVNPNAKRLFSDSFMLAYIRTIGQFGLVRFAHAIPLTNRPDVRNFLNDGLIKAQDIMNKTKDLMEQKGIPIKPPFIPPPEKVEYVPSKSWYGSFFNNKRPINVVELAHIFERLEAQLVERAMLLGFTQVVRNEKVKAYFLKTGDILDRQINRWSNFLNQDYLTIPSGWNSEVTDSNEPTFSDKLMLFHFLSNLAYSINYNGFAFSSINRKDLVSAVAKTVFDLTSCGKSGQDLMIQLGWMEKIPLVPNREKLTSN